eukprot:jgi/Hompol1/2987/HPOL_003086-RA
MVQVETKTGIVVVEDVICDQAVAIWIVVEDDDNEDAESGIDDDSEAEDEAVAIVDDIEVIADVSGVALDDVVATVAVGVVLPDEIWGQSGKLEAPMHRAALGSGASRQTPDPSNLSVTKRSI